MSTVKTVQHQIGLNTPPEQNFTLTAEAADGTMALKRGVPGNYIADIFSMDADNFVHGETPPQFTTDKRMVNAEFVQRALGNYSDSVGINSNTTLDNTYSGKIIGLFGPTSFSVNLPSGSTMTDGSAIEIHQGTVGGATVNISSVGSDTINTGISQISTFNMKPGDNVKLVWSNAGNWIMLGEAQLPYSPLFLSSAINNGYQKLPSGLIIQWCSSSAVPAGGTLGVSFPIAFPSACLFCLASPIGSVGQGTATTITVGPLSTTGVTLYSWGNTACQSFVYALGK